MFIRRFLLNDAPVTAAPASVAPTSTENAPAKPAVPAVEQKEKIKVNKQEREYTLAELKNLASKAAAADERFMSASQMEKKANEVLEGLKGKKLVATLEKAGYSKQDIRQILEQELTPFVEEDMMSPEERERAAKDRKLAEYEEEKAAREREQMSAKERQELDRELSKLNNEFLSALEKSSLPRDPFLGKMVAQQLIGAEQNGYEMSVDEAVEIVHSQFEQNTQSLLSSMSIDKLKQFLGKDTLSKLRDADVQQVRDAERPFAKQGSKPAVRQDSEPSQKPKKDAAGFFNKLRGVNFNKQ